MEVELLLPGPFDFQDGDAKVADALRRWRFRAGREAERTGNPRSQDEIHTRKTRDHRIASADP